MAVGYDESVPLYSVEAEMSTLGAMLLSERAAEEIVTILAEDDFYAPRHRLVFRAMKSLIAGHKPIDMTTLTEELKARGDLANIGGPDYLTEIDLFVPTASNSAAYGRDRARQGHDAALGADRPRDRRRVHDAETPNVQEKVDKAEQLIFEVGRKQLGKYFEPVSKLAKEFFVDVDTILETGVPMQGQKVGFLDLDEMTSGFYPGDFVVCGARPAMGKTSLILEMALNVATQHYRQGTRGSVAIFSLEMSSIQLTRRLVSMLSSAKLGAEEGQDQSDGLPRSRRRVRHAVLDADLHRRQLGPVAPRDARQVPPPEGRARPEPRHDRLPAAHARIAPDGEPCPGDLRDRPFLQVDGQGSWRYRSSRSRSSHARSRAATTSGRSSRISASRARSRPRPTS